LICLHGILAQSDRVITAYKDEHSHERVPGGLDEDV
jgi:hypothetical protein